MTVATIGIIGAGKLGTVLAQLALKAGYQVNISGSGDPGKIELIVSTLAPGAKVATNEEVAASSDAVILALPLKNFRQLPQQQLSGKLVIDATNYWWETDGPRSEILPDNQSSSEAIQEFLASSRVIKTFSHMGYHHLHDEARPANTPGRKAIAVAGDNQDDITVASQIVDALGFDPIVIGSLAEGRKLEPGAPAFGAHVDKEELRSLVKTTESN